MSNKLLISLVILACFSSNFTDSQVFLTLNFIFPHSYLNNSNFHNNPTLGDINEDGTYHIEDGKPFGPENVVWEYENDFHSGSQSGAFRLPNGNTLVTVASESYIFEVTHDKEIVWEYRSENGIIPRAKKYGIEYFFISGDMNDDDVLNILDIIQLQNLILENTDLNESQIQLGDMNSDGELNIIDIIYLINHILNS